MLDIAGIQIRAPDNLPGKLDAETTIIGNPLPASDNRPPCLRSFPSNVLTAYR